MSRTICLCNKVTEKEVRNLFKKSPLATLPDIARFSGASMSCGRCRTELSALVSEMRNKSLEDHNTAIQLVIPFEEG